MSKNVKVNGVDYSGVSQIQLKTTAGGTALFKDVDEITTPSGTINITENGTHNVLDYAQAVVNVASGGSDDENTEFAKLMAGMYHSEWENIGPKTFVYPDGAAFVPKRAFLDRLPDSRNVVATINLPDSIVEIREGAFDLGVPYCINELPKNLKHIGKQFAGYAYNLFGNRTVLEIPESVETISTLAFYMCNSPAIATITFLGTPTTIADDSFLNNAITTINVPWAEGAVANAPWGATSATINYNYTGA